jgi:hypothetical protein
MTPAAQTPAPEPAKPEALVIALKPRAQAPVRPYSPRWG